MKFTRFLLVVLAFPILLGAGCGPGRPSARDSLTVIEVRAREIPQFFAMTEHISNIPFFLKKLGLFKRGFSFDAFSAQYELEVSLGNYGLLRLALLCKLKVTEKAVEDVLAGNFSGLSAEERRVNKQWYAFLQASLKHISRYVEHEMREEDVVFFMNKLEGQVDAWIVHLQAELDEA